MKFGINLSSVNNLNASAQFKIDYFFTAHSFIIFVKVVSAVHESFRKIASKSRPAGILINVLSVFTSVFVEKPEINCRIVIKGKNRARPIQTQRNNYQEEKWELHYAASGNLIFDSG